MELMAQLGSIIRVRGLLGLIACVAVNLWLFRFGMLPGLVGLNVTKHVAIAALCRGAGVNRRGGEGGIPGPSPRSDSSLLAGPQIPTKS